MAAQESTRAALTARVFTVSGQPSTVFRFQFAAYMFSFACRAAELVGEETPRTPGSSFAKAMADGSPTSP